MKISIKRFFGLCAGLGDNDFENSSQITRSLYAGIGASILFTAVLTVLSFGYAIKLVVGSGLASLALAILFGGIVFNLDRFIVISSRSSLFTSIKTKVWLALPRILLSILLSVVIVQPLALRLFEGEVNAQIQKEVNVRIEQKKSNLEYEIDQRKQQIEQRNIKVDRLFLNAYEERIGRDGTGILGEGFVFKAKITEAKQARGEADKLNALDLKAIEELKEEINRLEQDGFRSSPSSDITRTGGLLARIRAFNEIAASNATIKFSFILLALLFVVLTATPLVLSLLVRSKPEDEIINELDSIIERHMQMSQEDIERDKEKTRDILGKLQPL